MRKELITVPKGKFLLDFLAGMGSRLHNDGILISPEHVRELIKTADRIEMLDSTAYILSWKAAKVSFKTTIILVGEQFEEPIGLHYRAVYINAKNIKFNHNWNLRPVDYFFEMEK